MQTLPIVAEHEAMIARALPAAADLTRAVPIVLHGQSFFARTVPPLPARLPNVSCRHAAVPVSPKSVGACGANRKLVFNIRISTEDEINGTVKGVV
ncbi:hypothetical protein [Bradyrhizobium iriomotense]|uniref:hypothetical protein n=1 Tax=Bradyrhizobium iriomotense TaxID=441950 RepID=UPI001B8A20C9|nr:hypothetical protein [Bradyrhizobium iriomotense]MBR1133485.1 hypothetical protein [Bradyrhizobium iriomotense]